VPITSGQLYQSALPYALMLAMPALSVFAAHWVTMFKPSSNSGGINRCKVLTPGIRLNSTVFDVLSPSPARYAGLLGASDAYFQYRTDEGLRRHRRVYSTPLLIHSPPAGNHNDLHPSTSGSHILLTESQVLESARIAQSQLVGAAGHSAMPGVI
jgi:hypothetical protein